MNLVKHAEPRWMVGNGPHLPWHHQAAIAASKAAHLRHKTFASQGRWRFGRIAAAREFIRWLRRVSIGTCRYTVYIPRWSSLITLDFHVEHDRPGVLPAHQEEIQLQWRLWKNDEKICRSIWSGCSKSCSPSTKTRLGAWDFNPFH